MSGMRRITWSRATEPGFDPASLRARQHALESRVAAAIQRIGDQAVICLVAPLLREGDAAPLLLLLVDGDVRVRRAAHECAILRYAYVVALAARTLGLDDFARDDLVQRTFENLPDAVARATARDRRVVDLEGWIRQRAFLIGRQMFREEHGSPRRDAKQTASLPSLDNTTRTHGARVPLELIDDEAIINVARGRDGETDRCDALLAAVDVLAQEQPAWAEILRLHYFEGFRLDEIAGRVGRSHGTTRNDASKARARLREIIRERFPDLAPRWDSVDGAANATL